MASMHNVPVYRCVSTITENTLLNPGGCASAVQKRCRADTDGQDEVGVPPPKTAIELAMEEAEEYERRKEAEQRRLLGGATV